MVKPYIRDRVETFFDPSQSCAGRGLPDRQSLIAIGSGGLFGRGFGQGIQKFTYLPEPMGTLFLQSQAKNSDLQEPRVSSHFFLSFALRGFQIAAKVTDPFGSYLATGISTYLTMKRLKILHQCLVSRHSREFR